NNHHYYASTANQGFFWRELDISYYVIRTPSFLGLANHVRVPTDRARFKHWIDKGARDRLLARYGQDAPDPHVHDAPDVAHPVTYASMGPTSAGTGESGCHPCLRHASRAGLGRSDARRSLRGRSWAS